MKTVVYQIPVSPVEEKKGRDLLSIEKTTLLQNTVNDAYHIANRAVTLWLSELFPATAAELITIKDAYKLVSESEAKLKTAISNKLTQESEVEILKNEKRLQRKNWEDAVAKSGFYKKVKDIIKNEFPAFPERLRTALLHKVVLDWLYTSMNQKPDGSFSAAFSFYKHEMHVPLCYDGTEVKWKKLTESKDGSQQYILKWLNGIEFKTSFSNDKDKRLPVVLEQLYFTPASVNVRNRKEHNLLKPTLKKAGTKWSIHIPVLEAVEPVKAERQEPLNIVFGFIHPICYAWGTNHAKPLGMDNGSYITTQMKKFERRTEKATASSKLTEEKKKASLEKIEKAKASYIESLYTKAVNAVSLLARKAQKNKVVIEQWPVSKPVNSTIKIKGTPDINNRFLCMLPGWNFNRFYSLLQKELNIYSIELIPVQPMADAFELYTASLTYTFKNKETNKKETKNWMLSREQLQTQNYYPAGTEPKKLEGCFTFSFDKEYNPTNGGFT
jgi:hypothetical protein